jgi:hypothetical protein
MVNEYSCFGISVDNSGYPRVQPGVRVAPLVPRNIPIGRPYLRHGAAAPHSDRVCYCPCAGDLGDNVVRPYPVRRLNDPLTAACKTTVSSKRDKPGRFCGWRAPLIGRPRPAQTPTSGLRRVIWRHEHRFSPGASWCACGNLRFHRA